MLGGMRNPFRRSVLPPRIIRSGGAQAQSRARPKRGEIAAICGGGAVRSLLFAAGLMSLSACSKRMGHNVEDLTTITSGPLSGQVAILDGYEVFLTPSRRTGAKPVKAFDLYGTSISGGPRGIAYIPEQSAFVFTNPRKPKYLLRSDLQGRELPPLELRYPEGFVHYHSEGLAYVPADAPKYAGRIIMVSVQLEPEFKCRLFVVNTQGVVEDEIVLEGNLHNEWIATVAYDARAGLWVSQGDNKIHHFDLNGKKLGEAVEIGDAQSLEGIAGLADGTLFVGDLFDGRLRRLDQKLQRDQEDDREYTIGDGVSFPLALGWRSDIHRLAVKHLTPNGFRVVDTTPELNEVREEFILEKDSTYQSSMTWIDEEGVYAILRVSSGELWMVDPQGNKVSSLDLSAHSPIQAIDYIPSTKQFVLLRGAVGSKQELHLVTREGTAVGEFDLSELAGIDSAVSMASYHWGSAPAFVVGQTPEAGTQFVAFNLNGDRLWQMDYREELDIVYPANLSSVDGNFVQAFAVSDPGSSKISLFPLPQ